MSRHIATTVTATAVAAILITGAAAGSASPPGKQPPVNRTPPSISGTAQVGLSLTGAPGTWSGKGLKYAYKWLRCDAGGANCNAIGGASASTYNAVSGDAGATLRVIVTATNRNGSAAATSAATAVVVSAPSPNPPPPPPQLSTAATPPSVTSPPTIGGNAQQGQTLGASSGTWSGTTPLTYAYQWQRCDSGGGSCAPVAGATGTGYLLALADLGSTIRVSVTASNSAGSATAASAATAVVTATAVGTTISDEGTLRLGGSPTAMTNGYRFATVALGGYYDLFQPLPGRTIKYVSGAQCYDNDDIVASKATCRSNSWLIHNANGQEISYYSGGDGLLTNVGNVSYQNDLKQRILNFLAAHPWIDGVYFDNGAVSVTEFGASYPIYNQNNNLLWSNDSDFQKAQISFMSNVAAALKAAGYVVGYNARGFISGDSRSNNGDLAKWWMDQYAPYVTASMIEYWQQREDTHQVFLSGGDTWYHEWNGWESVATYAQSKGLEFWPVDYIAQSGEDSQCRFLRGSYLLDWNGKGSIMLTGWTSSDIWNTCTAFNPGLPSGAKYQVATGVWRREYANGYVIVNPTQSAVTAGGVTIASGDAALRQS